MFGSSKRYREVFVWHYHRGALCISMIEQNSEKKRKEIGERRTRSCLFAYMHIMLFFPLLLLLIRFIWLSLFTLSTKNIPPFCRTFIRWCVCVERRWSASKAISANRHSVLYCTVYSRLDCGLFVLGTGKGACIKIRSLDFYRRYFADFVKQIENTICKIYLNSAVVVAVQHRQFAVCIAFPFPPIDSRSIFIFSFALVVPRIAHQCLAYV